ncbi:MAG TPA: hypothetical protein VG457_00770 [Planctomycetota bacterium]|nr:hypothetical protein [Planctomycetota bacterium]
MKMNDPRVVPDLESDAAARYTGRQLAMDGLLEQAFSGTRGAEQSPRATDSSSAARGRGSRRSLWVGLSIASVVLVGLAALFVVSARKEKIAVVDRAVPPKSPAHESGGQGIGQSPVGPGAGEAARRPEDPPAPPDARWKIDFGLSLVEQDGSWVFVIDGATNLPPEVPLRSRVYAVQVYSDFKEGEREDEEPLVYEDEGNQPGFHRFRVPNGKFHEAVYTFARKPYSIRYRAKIEYVANEQTEPVRLRLGDDDFSRQADLRVGSDADYGGELKERVGEVADDLRVAEKLFGEASDSLAAFGKSFDARAWKEWKDPWLARVEALSRRNDQRYSLWAVWMERQAKMRVNGLCVLLRSIGARAEEQFTEGAKTQGRIEELEKAFHDYVEDAIEAIGIDAPLDLRRVGPIVAAYEKAIAPLRAWIRMSAGAAAGIPRAARHAGLAALQDLIPLLQNRKRGYFFVNEVSVRLTRLLELVDASSSAEVLIQGLQEHDAALAAFKDFAGLK